MASIIQDGKGLPVFFVIKTDGSVWCQRTDLSGSTLDPLSLGGIASEIAVAKNQDGRLEVFALGGGTVWHAWETEIGGTWVDFSAAKTLGGIATCIRVAAERDGRLHLFVVGEDKAVYHAWQKTANTTDEWVDFTFAKTLHGTASQICVVPNEDGRLVVFALGGDAVWYAWQTAINESDSWVDFSFAKSLGGIASQITASANADGRIAVFAIGKSDRKVYYAGQVVPNVAEDSNWVGFKSENNIGGIVSRIRSSRQPNGAIEVFGVGAGDGELYRITQTAPNGPWGAWVKTIYSDLLDEPSFVISPVSDSFEPAATDSSLSGPSNASQPQAAPTQEELDRRRVQRSRTNCRIARTVAFTAAGSFLKATYDYLFNDGAAVDPVIAMSAVIEAGVAATTACEDADDSEIEFKQKYGHEPEISDISKTKMMDKEVNSWDSTPQTVIV